MCEVEFSIDSFESNRMCERLLKCAPWITISGQSGDRNSRV
jgi:hypothetical protein